MTLNWRVTNATHLDIQPEIGEVSGNSAVVYPNGSTDYTLTATNSEGRVTASTSVALGGNTAPVQEDGLPPSGIFGVSLTQSDFHNDQDGNINSSLDPRVVRVRSGGTFYALVSYSDPGGISGVSVRIANQNPDGLAAPLVQGVEIGGFTLLGEVAGCDLSGTQTAVTCIYQIQVGNIPNIDALQGAGSEFAYVFRTDVTDLSGNTSMEAIRGYIVVGNGAGGGGSGNNGGSAPPANIGPNANFRVTSQEGLRVQFSASPSSDTDGIIDRYAWDFGDGSNATSRDFTKTFRSAGTYNVQLTITDNGGASDSVTKKITVAADGGSTPPDGAPVITSFTANPTSIAAGERSTLAWTVTGTVTALTLDQGIGGVLGSGDRTVSPPATTTYTLTAANGSMMTTRKLTLVVGEGEGGGGAPVAPTADFAVTTTGLTAQFTSTASDPDGNIVSYAWNFGDGSNATGDGPSKSYGAAGTFDVTLTVTDNAGLTGTVTKPVTVREDDGGGGGNENQQPTASFTTNVSDLQAEFTSTSADSDGIIAHYAWSFGDGVTGDGASPNHTYAQPGEYSVTLTVTDDDGAQASTTETVSVAAAQEANQRPTAHFSADVDGLYVLFMSTSSDPDGSIRSHSWDFGDGETSDSSDFFKSYAIGGTHTVTLTVTDDDGASASATRSITVQAPDDGGGGGGCCKICTTGKPCGDSCIANGKQCHQPPGCACSALNNPQGFQDALYNQMLSGVSFVDRLTGRNKCEKKVLSLVYAVDMRPEIRAQN